MAEDKLDTCLRRSSLEVPNIVIVRLKLVSIFESVALKLCQIACKWALSFSMSTFCVLRRADWNTKSKYGINSLWLTRATFI